MRPPNQITILPEPTPQNAIAAQMQFQIEVLKLLNHMALSLESIAKGIDKTEHKKP
jgi:hypothetical protein